MRHDEERPETTQLITGAPIPGHWIQVLATMRANTFTHLSPEEVQAEASHILIVSPTTEVARTCFAALLDSAVEKEFITIMSAEEVVPSDVPAGTWVFLPHRQDGWTELETTSARVRAALIKENTARGKEEKFTLIEYGVNLWLWAEPPSGGGDPVCHAGELISWESAWALGAPEASAQEELGSDSFAHTPTNASAQKPGSAAIRPPIYFGLPDVLRRRRMGE